MIKKIIALMSVVVMLITALPISSVAEDSEVKTGIAGNCQWILNGTVLTISGNGDMNGCSYNQTPWGTEITKVIINEGVTGICDYAFQNSKISEVIIPDSVTHIGSYAFAYCYRLNRIVISNNVTNIEYGAFSGSYMVVFETDESSYAYQYAKTNNIKILENNGWIGEKNNPLVSIDVPDIKIIENTNGIQKDGYFYYQYIGIKSIANYKDGEKSYVYAAVDDTDLKKQESSHWTAGQTYRVKAYYGNVECYTNVTIIKNPIRTLTVQDINISEGFVTNGGMNQYVNGISLDLYAPRYTVTLEDGTVLNSRSEGCYNRYNNYIVIEGREYNLRTTRRSIDNNALKAGSQFRIECELAGIKTHYNLNITESPFIDLHIDDVIRSEDEFSWDRYDYSPNSGYVTVKSGEKIELENGYFTYDNKTHQVIYSLYSEQSSSLKPNNTYKCRAVFGNLSTDYNLITTKNSNNSVADIIGAEIISLPKKTKYIEGEHFDLRGAVIRFSYADGSYEDMKATELYGLGYMVHSKSRSEYLPIYIDANNEYYVNVSDENVKLKLRVFWNDFVSPAFDCPVTVKENDWTDIKVSDWFTLQPKIAVTEKNGNTFVLNVARVENYRIGVDVDPWLYNSMDYSAMLHTDRGIFYADIYYWVDNGKEYFNIYMLNKKLKSNTVCGRNTLPEILEQKAQQKKSFNNFAFSRQAKIENKNGGYCLEQDYIYKDGSCKTIYMDFDKDLNIISYNIADNPTSSAGAYDRGDINKDGNVDVIDLISMKRRIAQNDTEEIKSISDFNNNGKIEAVDLIMLKKILIGTSY